MIFGSRKAGSMKFSRVWRKRDQVRSHLPHQSAQQKPRLLRNRPYGGKPRRRRRSASGGSELVGTIACAVPKYLPAAGRPLPSGLLSFSAKAHGGCEPLDPWNRDTRAGLAAAGPAHRAHLRQCHCSLGRHRCGSAHLPPSLPCTARPHPGIWQVQIPTMSQAPAHVPTPL